MSKNIGAVLSLKDNMSKNLLRVAKNTESLTKDMRNATRQVVAFSTKTGKAFDKIAKKATKWAAVTTGAAASLAAKVGFSEALDLEGYRLQLETATKDTVKAGKIMRYAVDLANRTPFEGGELVGAAAKFEAMGMAAKKWLPLAGDMAAATNKSFDQATEALIDAQTGELERLKAFGITKAKVLEQGGKLFAGVQIANNKGQITNQEKFNEALISLMQERFAGGMGKQATTIRGILSTVTGVGKSGLAAILGMGSDGTIKAGSVLDLIKTKATGLSDLMQKWQANGTFDKIATKVSEGLQKVLAAGKRAIAWVSENGDTIKRWAIGLGTALGSIKILQFAANVVSTGKVLVDFARGMGFIAAGANPIVLGVTAAIAAGSLLVANWDRVSAWAAGIRDQFAAKFASIRDSVVGAFDAIKTRANEVFEFFKEKFKWLDEKVENTPILGTLYKGVKGGISWVVEHAKGNALGTNYWRGGPTRINERGGEIVNLPSGTQIIPHDVSRGMVGGPTVNITVNIQGNVVGNREFIDELGTALCGRVRMAIGNI